MHFIHLGTNRISKDLRLEESDFKLRLTRIDDKEIEDDELK
jgi:hypothetical protein